MTTLIKPDLQAELQKYTREEIREFARNFRIFCPKFLKIKDKDGNIAPFILNIAQLKVLDMIEAELAKGVPIRIIILKARQKGISTLIEAYIFWRTAFRKNRKSAVIGHEMDATNNMWEMTNRYFDNLPDWLKPEKRRHNTKELAFRKTKSQMMFWTAEKGDVGSAHTVQDVHITELSKWRDPKTTLTSLLQTVPDKPNTLVVIESTARGFGGEFYEQWQNAKKGKGYIPIFLSWLIDDEYTLKINSEEERKQIEGSLTETEQGLISKGATLEHLKWRRVIGIPQKCLGDESIFAQEYPSDDVEAFIASGSPVFNSTICNAKYNRNIQPIKIGNLEPVYKRSKEYLLQMLTDRTSYYDLLPYLESVKFIENPNGYLKLYESDLVTVKDDAVTLNIKEKEYYRFALASDVAEGLEQGDYSVIKVLDRKEMKSGKKLFFPITWHGHIDMDGLAIEQHKLQTWLKDKCYTATEKNNNGHAVILSAYKLKVKQYYAQDYKKGYEVGTDIIGVRTTGGTGGSKPEFINTLNEWIREGYFDDPETEFWHEALTFVRDSKGRMSAQNKLQNSGVKCYDDRIIAEALAIRCHLWMPNYYEVLPDLRPEWVKKQQKKKDNYTVMGI